MSDLKPRGTVEYDVQARAAALLKIPPQRLNIGVNLAEAGLDSIDFMLLLADLSRVWGLPLLSMGLEPQNTSCASLAVRVAMGAGQIVPGDLVVMRRPVVSTSHVSWLICPAGNGEIGFARRSMDSWGNVLGARGYGLIEGETIPASAYELGSVYWNVFEKELVSHAGKAIVIVGFSLGAWVARSVAAVALRARPREDIRLILLDPLPWDTELVEISETEFLKRRLSTWNRYTQGSDHISDWGEVARLAVARGVLPGYLNGADLSRLERFQFRTAAAAMKVPAPLIPRSLLVSSLTTVSDHRREPDYRSALHVLFRGDHAEVSRKLPWENLRSFGELWRPELLGSDFERV